MKGHKAILVLDNLPIHHSKKVKEVMEECKFRVRFLPPYSCSLNPIEKVWHVVKNKWRKQLVKAHKEDLTAVDALTRIDDILQGLD